MSPECSIDVCENSQECGFSRSVRADYERVLIVLHAEGYIDENALVVVRLSNVGQFYSDGSRPVEFVLSESETMA